jgi:hypothetical protein
MDEKGRPTIRAFADKAAARREQQTSPGTLLAWDLLRSKELATRCAFCDRAVYPEDACRVKFGATHGYGCCTHCSLGVAARLKQDIEVEARDGLTGELIRVKTLNGQIASLEPPTAIAWFGQKQGPDGQWVSAGCFKQGFFVNQDNLAKWLDARPAMTGRQIPIAQVLADKMKLSPEQIAKACKLGECKNGAIRNCSPPSAMRSMGAPALALGASFVWGILSIVLSPCHLASIPLIVGFISEQGQVTAKRAFWTSTLFSVGLLITIAAIGAITAAAGRMMGDVGRYGNYFVALIFFVVGLHLVGVIPLNFSGAGPVEMKRKGLLPVLLAWCSALPSAPAPLPTWPQCWR